MLGNCKRCGEGKIMTSHELSELHFWDRPLCIVKNPDGSHELFIPCADQYYDTYIDINYCPECGRELRERR